MNLQLNDNDAGPYIDISLSGHESADEENAHNFVRLCMKFGVELINTCTKSTCSVHWRIVPKWGKDGEQTVFDSIKDACNFGNMSLRTAQRKVKEGKIKIKEKK